MSDNLQKMFIEDAPQDVDNLKGVENLSKKHNWNVKEQESGVWRRVVPSPNPLYIFNG